MRKEKLNFKSIKEEAKKLANNESAKKFIKGARKDTDKNSEHEDLEYSEKTIKLVVEGLLKNRNRICQKPMQFYIKKEVMAWINRHTATGRGGQQIMLNFLIKKGIEAIEKEYEDSGVVFAKE